MRFLQEADPDESRIGEGRLPLGPHGRIHRVRLQAAQPAILLTLGIPRDAGGDGVSTIDRETGEIKTAKYARNLTAGDCYLTKFNGFMEEVIVNRTVINEQSKKVIVDAVMLQDGSAIVDIWAVAAVLEVIEAS
jgi:hypothetical protein